MASIQSTKKEEKNKMKKKLKRIFCKHNWQKFMGSINQGNGKFSQKYVCSKCGKNKDGIVRLESSGTLKEFIFKEDLLDKKKSPLLLCFKGKDSSGIIEFDSKDLDRLYREITRRTKMQSQMNVMKFEK